MEIKTILTGSENNLYLISTLNNDNYLLECGARKSIIIKYLYKYNKTISDFKGCFISHGHSDHCESAKWVNSYMPIYSNYELMQKGYKGEILRPNQKKEFDDFTVIPFNVNHGNIENYAYIFKDEKDIILFATDFYTFDTNLSKIKFTKLFIECNWTKDFMDEALADKDGWKYTKFERQYQTHCSLDILIEVLKTLNLINCYNIILIHKSKEVCNQKLALERLSQLFPGIKFEFAVCERLER